MGNDDRITGDEAKGRVKQAAGDLVGDEELKKEGEVDETKGEVKSKIDKAADKVSEKVDDVADKFKS